MLALVAALAVPAALAPIILSIRGRLPDLSTVIVVGAADGERAALGAVHFFEDLLAEQTCGEPVTASTISDETAFWLYSSGSTGEPKGVKLVGELPASLQNYTTYAAAEHSGATAKDAAKSFLVYLATPAAKQTFKEAGIE